MYPSRCNAETPLFPYTTLFRSLALAGGGVAGEADAGGAVGAAVAEHHRLHVDAGAEALGDAVQTPVLAGAAVVPAAEDGADGDRKSTRLNSSHSQTSYADFCLK